MEDGKDREQKISEKLRCDTAKFNLSYYLNRKDLSDSTDSLVNLHSVRGFGTPQLMNSRKKPLLTNLVHSFRNDKK